MNAGAALSALLPSPQIPSPPAQVASEASPSQFQNIYQNLPDTQHGAGGDTAHQTHTAAPPQQKKKSPDQTAIAQTAITPLSNPIVFPKAQKVFSLSVPEQASNTLAHDGRDPASPNDHSSLLLPVATNTVAAVPAVPAALAPATPPSVPPTFSTNAQTKLDPASLSLSESASAPRGGTNALKNSRSSLPGSAAIQSQAQQQSITLAPPDFSASTPAASAATPAQGQTQRTDTAVSQNPQSTQPPVVQQNGETMVRAEARNVFPLLDENLAFSLRMASSAVEPTSDQKRDSPAVARTLADAGIPASDSNSAQVSPAAQLRPAPSSSQFRPLPEIKPAPAESASTQAGPRNNRPAPESQALRPQTYSATKPSGPAASPDATVDRSVLNAVRQVSPESALWNGTATHIDVRPAASSLPEPGPSTRPALLAQLADVPQVAAEPPKLTAGGEIVLHLDNGQAAAAVRVMDRGGAINVAVHAADPQLRNNLRSNLSDLTSQLNAQGLKAETVKPALAQGASENRPDQGDPQQRSSHQQQPSPQGERNGQRDRRGNGRWLEEFAEQTSASTANLGGTNS